MLTEIVYGTIQRKNTIDYYLQKLVKKPLLKLDSWVLVLLRLSIYQIVYLDRVPERAVVHEAVEIAKKRGHIGISGMVNGTLRAFLREGIPEIKANNLTEELALKYSHPNWLIERWIEQFGIATTEAICSVNNTPPKVTARANLTSVADVDQLMASLAEEEIIVERGDLAPEAIKVVKGNLVESKAYRSGQVTIQDESSMLVAKALAATKGMTVLDSCAAPGGKTTHIAETMNNEGKVVALDLHPHKVKLIVEQAKRLQLTNIETKASDARNACELFEKETFDRILVDAPCSGLGVIRRKPDIKWQKKANDMNNIAKIQYDLLTAVAPLLKVGGTLVYSTCTIDRVENEQIVTKFLEEHKHFKLDKRLSERLPAKVASKIKEEGMIQLLPSDFDTDGFFIAALVKN